MKNNFIKKPVVYPVIMIICLSSFIMNVNANCPDCCPDGMISYWRAEGNADDFCCTPCNDGTLMGGASIQTSPIPQVGTGTFSFSSTGDYVDISNPINIPSGTDDFTLEAWINEDATQPAFPAIISNRGGNGNNGFLFGLWSDGKLHIQLGGYNQNTGSTDLRGPGWHHVAVVRSGTRITYYVDGNQDGIANSGRSINSNYNLRIGWDAVSNSATLTPWRGQIDEVAIYDRALDEFEIQCHYCLGLRHLGYCDEGCHKCAFSGSIGQNMWSTPPIDIPTSNQYGAVLNFTTACGFYSGDYGSLWLSTDGINPLVKFSVVTGHIDCNATVINSHYISPLGYNPIYIMFQSDISNPTSWWYVDNIKILNIDGIGPPMAYGSILYTENFECYNIDDILGPGWTVVGTEIEIERPLNHLYIFDWDTNYPTSQPITIGKITIEAEASSKCCCEGISKVTFEVIDSNGQVITTGVDASPPYSWTWSSPTIPFQCPFPEFTIRVTAITKGCGCVSDEIKVRRLF